MKTVLVRDTKNLFHVSITLSKRERCSLIHDLAIQFKGCMLGYDTRACGGLDMYLFWTIMFMLILVWMVLFIPFSVFYYEEDDGVLLGKEPKSRVCIAAKYELMVLFVVAVIFTLCYLFLSVTNIPIVNYSGIPTALQATTLVSYPTDGTFSINQFEDISTQEVNNAAATTSKPGVVELRLSAPVFFIGLMVFFGWFCFAIFGGIGLPALPLDFILAFVNRPRHMVCLSNQNQSSPSHPQSTLKFLFSISAGCGGICGSTTHYKRTCKRIS